MAAAFLFYAWLIHSKQIKTTELRAALAEQNRIKMRRHMYIKPGYRIYKKYKIHCGLF